MRVNPEDSEFVPGVTNNAVGREDYPQEQAKGRDGGG